MSPTADATLLPPPLGLDSDDDDDAFDLRECASRRSLDQIGAMVVLGAMVEQRRASRPLDDRHDEVDDVASDDRDAFDGDGDGDADATQPNPTVTDRRRVPASSDAFLKAR